MDTDAGSADSSDDATSPKSSGSMSCLLLPTTNAFTAAREASLPEALPGWMMTPWSTTCPLPTAPTETCDLAFDRWTMPAWARITMGPTI